MPILSQIALRLTLTAMIVCGSAEAQTEAQTGAQTAPPTPTLQVFSRESILDVTVTDAHNLPVHGLTRADFTIKEDARPQPVRSFLETGGNVPPPTRALPTLPPGVYSNLRPAPLSGASNILLLDTLNVSPRNQIFVRQQVRQYLDHMPAGTEVALLVLANGLRLLQGFTTDPDALIAALDSYGQGLLQPNSPAADRNLLTLEALRQIASFVAGTRGRKNLIWFTTGIRQITDPQFRTADMPDYAPELHRTYAALAAAQVAIYSIDARGLIGFSSVNASGPATLFATAASANVQRQTRDIAGDILSMESVAESTGGGAFYNTNGLTEALAKAVNGGASYYTLSYVPPGKQDDGRFHSIHVAVDRPGLHLTYRTGYWAEPPAQAPTTPQPTALATTTPPPPKNTLQASMARFAPPATQLLFDVRILPTTTAPRPTDPPVMGVPDPAYKGKPLVRYDLLYLLPSAQVAFAEAPDNVHAGAVQFAVVAYDVAGHLVTSRAQTMNFPFTPDEYAAFRKQPFQFFQQLDLPAGDLFLRIGLLDTVSNAVGTIEIPLTVSRPAGRPGAKSTAPPPSPPG